MHPAPIARWHQLVEANDPSLLDDLIAADAVFHSPAVHAPQVGKAMVIAYLTAAMAVFNNGTFRYREEWFGERSAALEFELTLDGVYCNGVDLIHWNDEGRIVDFKVMVRPMKGLNTVLPLMARQLAAQVG